MRRPVAGGIPSGTSRDSRWLGVAAAGLAISGTLFLVFAASRLTQAAGWAYDFLAYFDAAVRLIEAGTPYQAETLGGPFQPGPFGLYLYSPVIALLCVPLAWIGATDAVYVWLGLHVIALLLTCALMPVSVRIRLALLGVAALSSPVLIDVNLGNVSLFVTFLAVVVWRWLDRPIGSMALAASLTMRPTMALIGAWWLIRGSFRPLAWTAAAGLAIVAATVPFVGIERWLEYVTVLRNVSDVTGVPSNVDLGSSVLLLGGPPPLAPVALFAGYAVALTASVLSLRRDRELSYVVTLIAALLLAPLLWDHYLTMLLVPAAFLASRGMRWAVALPLLCWLPPLIVALDGTLRPEAQAILPLIALAAMLLPFIAPDRGPAAGVITDRLREGRSRSLEPGVAS